MYDIFFEKIKGRSGRVSSDAVTTYKKGSLQKSVTKNFAESTRKNLCRNLFFDKEKL